MNYLDCQKEDLKLNGGCDTAKEISHQPEVWGKTYRKIVEEKDQIIRFLDKIWSKECPYVIFTGAGTSAFIGESLVGAYQRDWDVFSRAIDTTNIITHPENYFIKSRPTLLISFARSGDSPESVATVDMAKEYCDDLYELIITCNPEGKLALNGGENSYVFLLPEETNDRSLAMTSSYSSMLLAGLLILNIRNIEKLEAVVKKMQQFGEYILDEHVGNLKKVAEMDFERVVCLGSGPLFGVAHESHLKIQELSDGKVICKFDSFLGFRHGPKAVVNDSTLMLYLLSNNMYARQYEVDLMRSVKETAAGEKAVIIGDGFDKNEFDFEFCLDFPGGTDEIPEDFLSVFYVLPAQIIGFFKSLGLGHSPDSPSKGGAISRVVKGVKIYDAKETKTV